VRQLKNNSESKALDGKHGFIQAALWLLSLEWCLAQQFKKTKPHTAKSVMQNRLPRTFLHKYIYKKFMHVQSRSKVVKKTEEWGWKKIYDYGASMWNKFILLINIKHYGFMQSIDKYLFKPFVLITYNLQLEINIFELIMIWIK